MPDWSLPMSASAASTKPTDATTSPPAPFETHSVDNQARPLEDYNVFLGDKALVEAVDREGGGWIRDRAAAFGARCGAAATIRDAELAERFSPQLKTHDRFGRRIDEVEF